MTNSLNLPDVNHAETLMIHWCGLFVDLLRTAAAGGDQSWQESLEMLQVCSLTQIRTPSGVAAKPIEIDNDKLDNVIYKRNMLRQIKACRPSKWHWHNLVIEREMLSKDDYAIGKATVLAWNFTKIVLADGKDDPATMLMLTKLDAAKLARYLRSLRLKSMGYKLSGKLIARENLIETAEECIENSETFKRLLIEISATVAEARAQLKTEIEPIIEKVRADLDANWLLFIASIRQNADSHLKEMRTRAAIAEEKRRKFLEEHRTDPNPQVSFRKEILRQERERRAQRLMKWLKIPFYIRYFSYAIIISFVTGLAFFLEIGESRITPVEALSKLTEALAAEYDLAGFRK